MGTAHPTRLDASKVETIEMSEVTFRAGDLPSSVIDYIKNTISRYSVVLVRLDSSNNPRGAASGTFVLVRGRPAILTARHFIDGIKNNMGLALTDSTHKFVLERHCLEFAIAPRGETESSGPDLGLIYITGPKIGTIKAMKSFFNLDSYVPSIGKEVDMPKTGLWAVFGILKEFSHITPSQQELAGRVYLVGGFNYYESNGYDYFDFDFRSPHPGRVPSSLEGMSGGGVWHARILYNPSTKKVDIPNGSDWLTLLGVNFYQSSISNGGRDLRTHGPKSIYVKLFEWAYSHCEG